MKNSASRLLKQIIAGVASMAKSKSMALKSKTNAIKARLIIFSLMRNKKFLMSSISEKFHSVLGHHRNNKDENCYLEEEGGAGSEQNRAMVVYNSNARSYEALPNPSETQLAMEEQDGYDDDGDGDKYPDLTHTLFDEDLDLGGSVIDLVKNSKEEKGQEFKLEDEIDHVADLFIKRFRRQMILQKQDSLKRQQEILQRGV